MIVLDHCITKFYGFLNLRCEVRVERVYRGTCLLPSDDPFPPQNKSIRAVSAFCGEEELPILLTLLVAIAYAASKYSISDVIPPIATSCLKVIEMGIPVAAR
jgi:hypothetical protein